jgi:hypothetical protein
MERFIEETPFFETIGTPLIVSSGGETIEEYVELAHRVNREKGSMPSN